ncbi:MAG: Na+/H+ antiporter subunit E [Haloferacaceae archaeon]
MLVRGVELTPVRLAEEGLIGLAVGIPVAYAARRFYVPMTGLDRRVRVLPFAALYVAAFVYELVTANVDVARRVLAPRMPIYPDVVEVPLRVRSDLAITTIANSITLTPGTLTMDYDSDANALYVHCIDGRDPDAVRAPIRRWEDYALVIFDEELKPGDPAPPVGAAADGGTVERAGESVADAEATDAGEDGAEATGAGVADDGADDDAEVADGG